MWSHSLKLTYIALIILCHAGCVSRSFLDGSTTGRNQQSTGSAEKDKKAEAFNELAVRLERLGFFKHTERDLLEEAKAEVSEAEYLFAGSTERDYLIHPEDLAEGGVKTFLEEISFFLKREAVAINEIEENFEVGGTYSITVDGRPYVIYSHAEHKSKELQELTTRRAFALVNTLLEQAGSSERIYLFRDGNETWAVFLTPDMFRIILQSSLIDDENKPKFVG
jgi:hypothetical protein